MKMKFLFTLLLFCSNIQVMRIKEVITKDKMSWHLAQIFLTSSIKIYGEQ